MVEEKAPHYSSEICSREQMLHLTDWSTWFSPI